MIVNIGISFTIIITFTIIQILLSKKGHWWKGLLLPSIYLLFTAKDIISTFDTTIRLIPNYYQAATLFFPSVWLLMIYYIYYYYWKCKGDMQ